jgi:ABC-type nickel/cobalt efflux system permease component RcnA
MILLSLIYIILYFVCLMAIAFLLTLISKMCHFNEEKITMGVISTIIILTIGITLAHGNPLSITIG